MIKIKFIEQYLTYPKGKVLSTTKSNAQNLFILGVAEEVKEEAEKPKRGRKPKLKDTFETK